MGTLRPGLAKLNLFTKPLLPIDTVRRGLAKLNFFTKPLLQVDALRPGPTKLNFFTKLFTTGGHSPPWSDQAQLLY